MDDSSSSGSGRARKRAIRARMARTGESWTAAARHHDQDPTAAPELNSAPALEPLLNYPTAITAGPEHGDRGVIDGLRWLSAKANELGGQPVIYAPQKSNIRDNSLLEQFSKLPGVAVGTWKAGTTTGWSGGPVLAAWPSLTKLGEIADDRSTTALCGRRVPDERLLRAGPIRTPA